jgi:hypothetical protein
MSEDKSTGRRGRHTCMTLTPEADQVLRQMVPGPKCLGRFVSGLILQERARQEERQQRQLLGRGVYGTSGVENID